MGSNIPKIEITKLLCHMGSNIPKIDLKKSRCRMGSNIPKIVIIISFQIVAIYL